MNETDVDRVMKGFENDHLRSDPRLMAIITALKGLPSDQMLTTIASLHTPSLAARDEKAAWRGAALAIHFHTLTTSLIANMKSLEASNERLSRESAALTVAVGKQGERLTLVVGIVGAVITIALALPALWPR